MGYSHNRVTRQSAERTCSTLDTTRSPLLVGQARQRPTPYIPLCVCTLCSRRSQWNRTSGCRTLQAILGQSLPRSGQRTTPPSHTHTLVPPPFSHLVCLHTHTDTALTRTHHLTEIPFSLALRRRVALLLACTTVTSALPDMEVHKGSARELLWASNDPTPTPTPQPRSGS